MYLNSFYLFPKFRKFSPYIARFLAEKCHLRKFQKCWVLLTPPPWLLEGRNKIKNKKLTKLSKFSNSVFIYILKCIYKHQIK